jgi:cyclic pyranopterin phosphate synthase
MSDQMTFLPRTEVLTLEEIAIVGRAFVGLGVSKIRISGGEPLVRQNVDHLFRDIGRLPGLEKLCITTNGAQLAERAKTLRAAGVTHVNISLDSLRPDRFKQLTRYGDLSKVLTGVDAAQQAGFVRVKLNAVVLKHFNQDEVLDLVRFALARQIDISFIEEMPLGQVHSHSRSAEFVSSQTLRDQIAAHFDLVAVPYDSGGPSRYWQVKGTTSRIGFISPHSENFCAQCNRVRVTASGRLLLCLGNENSLDLRALLRDNIADDAAATAKPCSATPPMVSALTESTALKTIARLQKVIRRAIIYKPERHHFDQPDTPQPVRFMNMSGG